MLAVMIAVNMFGIFPGLGQRLPRMANFNELAHLAFLAPVHPVFSTMSTCQLLPFSSLVYFGVLIKRSLKWQSS